MDASLTDSLLRFEFDNESDAASCVAWPSHDTQHLLADGFAQRLHMLAQRLGASAQAVRTLVFTAAQVSRASADGQICVSLDTLAARLGEAPRIVRAALFASGLACDGRARDAELLPLVLDEEGRLYLARYYGYERRAANGFNALAASGRLMIISGGPGAGKTTRAARMLARLLDENPALCGRRIALAAPTGKAAQRLLEALAAHASSLPEAIAQRLPKQAFTLHRLLGAAGASFRPSRPHRFDRSAPLPYEIIIIDEASMIDVTLAAQLVDALAPHTRLILLGDKDQLSAVEAGAVFAELSAQPARSGASSDSSNSPATVNVNAALPSTADNADKTALADCVVWLDHHYRFGPHSAIGRLALALRATAPADALAALTLTPQSIDAARAGVHKADAILVDDHDNMLSAHSLDALAQGFAPYATALGEVLRAASTCAGPELALLFEALNRYRVLAAMRFGPRGVKALNALLATRLCALTGVAAPNDAGWFAGRPVMITRNDYALELFNGDTGLALPAADGALRVIFSLPRSSAGGESSGFRALCPAVLPPHETALALTVHKAQGSEFDQLAFVLPAKFSGILTRELIYTAITRARQKLTIFGAPEIFAQAVATPAVRASGFAARLRELAAAQAGK